jgi:hypothetical protein
MDMASAPPFAENMIRQELQSIDTNQDCGVLTLTLPKSAEAQKAERNITIKAA